MKSLLLAFFCLYSFSSRASDEKKFDSNFVSNTTGSPLAVSNDSSLYQLPEEVEDWSDSVSATTTRLNEQCGILVEMKILRSDRINYLFIGLQNNTKENYVLDLKNSIATFGDGRERLFIQSDLGQEIILPNNYGWGIIPFKNKEDFRNQTSLSVSIPTITENKTCNLTGEFKRNSELPEQDATTVDASSSLLSVDISILTEKLGRLDSLTDNHALNRAFTYQRYSTPYIGWFFQFSMSDLGDYPDKNAFENNNYDEASSYEVTIGRVWRFIHEKKFHSTVSVGPSIANFQACLTAGGGNDSRYGAGVFGSYMFDGLLNRQTSGSSNSDIRLGVSIWGRYYFGVFNGGNKDAGLIGTSLNLIVAY